MTGPRWTAENRQCVDRGKPEVSRTSRPVSSTCPFLALWVQQRPAKRGKAITMAGLRRTRRNRKTRRLVGHQRAIQQLTASRRKARLTPSFLATNQEVASSSLAGRTIPTSLGWPHPAISRSRRPSLRSARACASLAGRTNCSFLSVTYRHSLYWIATDVMRL